MKKEILLIAVLVVILFLANYNFLDSALKNFLEEKETGLVERIVDGDTAIINGNSTRFLGINTPEKGEKYYKEAKEFLEKLILNKTVTLEYGKERYDKYNRKLAYIILDGKNINVEIIKNGFANFYIYDKDKHTDELKNAWEECLKSDKNLCETSSSICKNCIILTDLNPKMQEAIFSNNCDLDCEMTGWTIKDEGRKKFIFPKFVLAKNTEVQIAVGNKTNSGEILFWSKEEYVWTSGGDTLFLRDKEGKLVLWKNY